MVYGLFQPNQKNFVKHVLVMFVIILTLIPVVKAEDKSWYEIDGIRVRPVLANSHNPIVIYMPWKIEKRISPYLSPPPLDAAIIRQDEVKNLFPFAIELPETLMLMTSWSFGGALFEFEFPTEVKDLDPGYGHQSRTNPVNSDGIEYRRQTSSDRTSLYNEFFNTSDKAFADANSDWALSADVNSSRIFLGYIWGFFIPIGENHRFFKFGAGLGVYYIDLSFKLNLCSQYIVTPKDNPMFQDNYDQKYKGECVGKTEIDSFSGKKFGIASTAQYTFYERRTKDSIWRLFATTEGVALGSDDKGYIRAKLKNHSKSLALWMSSQTEEIISYTYRF